MSLTSEMVEDIQVLKLGCPNLDISTYKEISRLFDSLAGGGKAVIFDFSEIRSIDSAGFGAMMMWRQRLRSKGANMMLCSLSAEVDRAFRAVKLHLLFPVHPDRDSAIRSAKQTAGSPSSQTAK